MKYLLVTGVVPVLAAMISGYMSKASTAEFAIMILLYMQIAEASWYRRFSQPGAGEP